MNHKRRKPRTKIRCEMCTDSRLGNSGKDDRKADKIRKIKIKEEIQQLK